MGNTYPLVSLALEKEDEIIIKKGYENVFLFLFQYEYNFVWGWSVDKANNLYSGQLSDRVNHPDNVPANTEQKPPLAYKE